MLAGMLIVPESSTSAVGWTEMLRNELCTICNESTGRAGEGDDSLFFHAIEIGWGRTGPLCQDCYEICAEEANDEIERRRG
jgi:hypothetical protein